MKAAERLIVALDISDLNEVKRLLNDLVEVQWYKVGSQLFTAQGPAVIDLIKQAGKKIFLDLKFHDIPNTVVSGAVEAVKLGVDMFDIHVLGGFEMMESTVKVVGAVVAELQTKRPMILGVTILTSINEANLHDIFGVTERSLAEEILMLAQLANDAGLDGVVASAYEARAIKSSISENFIVVTPGVRPEAWADISDHARINSPRDALENGADFIVIGRPILRAKNPRQAALDILKDIET